MVSELADNTEHLIAKHTRILATLEAIKAFEQRRECLIEGVNGAAGIFPELRSHSINRIDTINRCINRLYCRI